MLIELKRLQRIQFQSMAQTEAVALRTGYNTVALKTEYYCRPTRSVNYINDHAVTNYKS